MILRLLRTQMRVSALWIAFICLPIAADFERVQVELQCPCTLQSEDGETAQIEFALKNNLNQSISGLYVTVAIFGELSELPENEDSKTHTALLDTINLELELDPLSENVEVNQTIDLGVMPTGKFFFELIVHYSETVEEDDILDSIYFRGEIQTPASSLDLVNFDFLVDTDGDGVDDENERMAGTDLDDSEDFPTIPIVDVLLLHTNDATYTYASDVITTLTHIYAVTEYMYEISANPVIFRPVALIDLDDVDGLTENQTLQEAQREELREEYGADVIAVYKPQSSALCGFAEAIGGQHDKGFLHPKERAIYTEIFLSTLRCGVSTTAHEIGHLMGLGHSFAQESTGAFHWSRGHGVQGEFATIMTYAYAAYTAIPLDVFSNPSLDCHDKPCGIPHSEPNSAGSADATRSVNITKYQFAKNAETVPDLDFDEDGFATPMDAFPLIASEWADTDEDGHGDNSDAFPDDPTEWIDTDGDGIGDNSDPDIDNDGVLNVDDAEPFDSTVNSLMLARIVSDEIDARLGWTLARINDIDSDGIEEIATAAPFANNDDGTATGRVFIFSPDEAISTENTADLPTNDRMELSLGADFNAWTLVGPNTESEFGKELKLLKHVQEGTDTYELFVASERSAHFVSMNTTSFEQLDEQDDTTDQVIHMDSCVQIDHCTSVRLDSDAVWLETATLGDIDEDGLVDLGFLATNLRKSELYLYVITRAAINRQFDLGNQSSSQEPISVNGIWQADDETLRFERSGLIMRTSIEHLGNLDENPGSELGISIVEESGNDSIYIVSTDQFDSLEILDADGDRRIEIDNLLAPNQSYRITYEGESWLMERSISHIDSVSDAPIRGELGGKDDFLAWGYPELSYLFTSEALPSLDELDGESDGAISFNGLVEDDIGVWAINNFSPTSRRHAKILRDSHQQLLDRLVVRVGRVFYTASLSDLAALDDPRLENFNQIINLPVHGRSEGVYAFLPPVGPYGTANFGSIESLGDLDEDGTMDFTVAVHSQELEGLSSSLYLIFSSDLDALDRADQQADHRILLQNTFVDTDGDGIPNIHDEDDDGDGLLDSEDQFGEAMAYRYDADRDGVPNVLDTFPLDRTEQFDIDFDGVGDNEDEDADGDGIPDTTDEHPYDTDNDGIRNRLDNDDDNDGVADEMDAFPLDPNEHTDTDGDGVGDNSDQFVNDPTEWLDSDGDGIGNNADEDDDNDGYLDTEDDFPLLASEWRDTDGDGVGDNTDQFPHNPLEWEDKDGDGFGDNFGVDGFGSYRLIARSEGSPGDGRRYFGARATDIGDVDGDRKDDIAINVAQTEGQGFPMFSVVVSDLAALDELDTIDDHVLDLGNIDESTNSWKYENERLPFDTLTAIQPAGDLDQDGNLDILVTAPHYPFFGDKTTGVHIVYGGDQASYDVLDGTSDHVIDYELCVQQSDCRMLELDTPQELHQTPTIVRNWFNEQGQSIAMGTVNNSPRNAERDGSVGVYVLPHSSIVNATQSGLNKVMVPTSILTSDPSITIYPEFGGDDPSSNSLSVWSMSDFTGDDRTDLLLYQDSDAGPYTYIFASDDIASADAADNSSDSALDLQNVYAQPASYRLNGFEPALSIFSDTTDFTSVEYAGTTHFPFRDVFSDGAELYLIDLSRLDDLDRVDGVLNGIIESLPVDSGTGVWRFDNLDTMQLCPVGPGDDDLFVLSRSIDNRFYVSNTKFIEDMDEADGATDGVVDFKRVLSAGIDSQWELSVSRTFDEDTLDAACVGDIDEDGYYDFGVSFKQSRGSTTEAHIVLLTYDDLLKLDELDDNVDGRVDVMILWRG